MNKQGSKTNYIYLNLNEISFQNLQVNYKMDFIIWNVLYVWGLPEMGRKLSPSPRQ